MVLDKLSCRLSMKAAVVLCSQKTDYSNSATTARVRGSKQEREVNQKVCKIWEVFLGCNILICLLICPWKLKEAASAQGCLLLLPLLVLHCRCSTNVQLTPKHTLFLKNGITALYWVNTSVILLYLTVYLRKHLFCYEITVWAKSAHSSYPWFAVKTKFCEHDPNLLVS